MEAIFYRDGGNTGVGIACYKTDYLTGDSNGNLIMFKKSIESDTKMVSIHSSDEITAVAISSNGNECGVAYNDTLSIRKFPNVEESILELAVRRTLAITNLVYDKDNQHIFVSSREPDIHIFNTVTKNIDYKLNTRDAGVRTFSLSPCGNT